MKKLWDNTFLTSVLLFLDNKILSQGDAFTNYSGLLYQIPTKISGYQAFSTPFRQLVNDSSISGANVLSGVYLNNTFVTIGQSGLAAINHQLGTVYFTGSTIPANTVVSGNYAIKDFSIQLTDQPEYKLLYETKFQLNSKFNQTLSGLLSDVKTIPAIFLKTKFTENRPGAFGGIHDNTFQIRATIIAENEFQRMAVANIFKNIKDKTLPIVNSTVFNHLGQYTGGTSYNYSGLGYNDTYQPLITEVKIIDIPVSRDVFLSDIGQDVCLADITFSTYMRHG